MDSEAGIEGDIGGSRSELTLTLCASAFSHDALHGTYDLLGDRRRHGRGVHGTMRMTTQVVHQLLQNRTQCHTNNQQRPFTVCLKSISGELLRKCNFTCSYRYKVLSLDHLCNSSVALHLYFSTTRVSSHISNTWESIKIPWVISLALSWRWL